jgi:hypothetical protein
MYRYFLAVALVLGLLPVIAFGGLVNTYPGWNGSDTICCFGYPDTSTYGEAITTPAGATDVTSFSFWLQSSGGAGFEFQAFISAWDNTNYELTGSMMYMSPVMTAADSNLDEYIFNVNVPVTPGTIYMFGATINNPSVYGVDSNIAYSDGAGMGGDEGSGGNSTYYFAYNNDTGENGPLYANWNSSANGGCADNTGVECGQAAFLATYSGSAVPEPGSLTLLGSALILLAGIARRRLQR